MRNTLFTLCCLLSCYCFADANDSYDVVKTSTAFSIDGDTSDWKDFTATKTFKIHNTGATANNTTHCKMAWDDNNLYMLFSVKDTDVTATFTNQDDNIFTKDDVIEMLFDYDGSGDNYLEIGVSANNVYFDFGLVCISSACGGWNSNNAWDLAGFESATKVHGTLNNASDKDIGYDVELKVPFSSFATLTNSNYTTVKEGVTWKGNLMCIDYSTGANTNAANEHTSWSTYTSFGYHQPTQFATFNFVGPNNTSKMKKPELRISQLTNTIFLIKSPTGKSIQLMDLTGKVITSTSFKNQYHLELQGQPKGIYFIIVRNEQALTSRRIVIK